MLNLNQNIIRQLNKIYGLSFKIKYKEEIKERIINFVSNIILSEPNGNLFEKINSKSNMIIINENKINLLTKYFFYKYKEDLLNSLNPLWYENKIKEIYTKREKEEMCHEMFNSFSEKIFFEINEKIKDELKRAEPVLYYTFRGLNAFKNNNLKANKQCSIFKIDYKLIKTNFNKELEILKLNISHTLVNLKTEIKQGLYKKYEIDEQILEQLKYISNSNLIINEIDIKNKKNTFNIDIGYKKTIEIKTKNREQTIIFIKYIALNRYIEIVEEILK